MSPAKTPEEQATRDQAVARLHAPVDAARAAFRGLVVVGHRRSIEAGEMLWALPGGQFAHAEHLVSVDPAFTVIESPSMRYLHDQQPVLRELTA